MITKERLKELIQQKATIYSTHWKEEVDLSLPCEIKYDGIGREFLFVHEDADHHPSYLLNNLTENVEDAKWEEEFSCIERTEKLYLPSFKEVCEDLTECTGEFIIAETSGFTLSIEKSLVDQILLRTQLEKYNWNFNKENYTLVCRKAKELFLGEKE